MQAEVEQFSFTRPRFRGNWMSQPDSTTNGRPSPTLAIVVGVAAISLAALFFRLAAPTHPLTAAAIRLLVASALLSPLVVRAFRGGRIDGRFVAHAVAGGVFYAVHFGCWVWSLELTTVAASVTLVTATPLLLAIWSLVRGVDRPTRDLWVALALALAGVTTIGGIDLGSSTAAFIGDGLAFAGAAGMAGYMLVVRRLGAIDVFAFTGIATLAGGALLAGIALTAGIGMAPASPTAFGFLVLAALIPQVIGHSALTWALRHASPTTVGIATLGEPVGATLLAWMFLAEVPAAVTLVGCTLTLTAVALAIRANRRAQRRAST
jgi:drug/metabolite transporter (DMT)-like permease